MGNETFFVGKRWKLKTRKCSLSEEVHLVRRSEVYLVWESLTWLFSEEEVYLLWGGSVPCPRSLFCRFLNKVNSIFCSLFSSLCPRATGYRGDFLKKDAILLQCCDSSEGLNLSSSSEHLRPSKGLLSVLSSFEVLSKCWVGRNETEKSGIIETEDIWMKWIEMSYWKCHWNAIGASLKCHWCEMSLKKIVSENVSSVVACRENSEVRGSIRNVPSFVVGRSRSR